MPRAADRRSRRSSTPLRRTARSPRPGGAMTDPPVAMPPDQESGDDACALLLRQRIRFLFRQLRKALAGDEEAIHQMRVSDRRLRTVLPLLARKPGGRRVRRALRRLRRLVRAASGSRDLDVALATLREHAQRSQEQRSESRVLVTRLVASPAKPRQDGRRAAGFGYRTAPPRPSDGRGAGRRAASRSPDTAARGEGNREPAGAGRGRRVSPTLRSRVPPCAAAKLPPAALCCGDR